MNETDVFEADVVADESEPVETVPPVETEIIAEVVEPERLLLTTPFEEYTVSEGLLLILVLLVVLSFCGRLLKGGLFWL